jgi:hypothetical protein
MRYRHKFLYGASLRVRTGLRPVGLDLLERRGRTLVADQRLGAVAPAVAEPLVEYGLAGNLVESMAGITFSTKPLPMTRRRFAAS